MTDFVVCISDAPWYNGRGRQHPNPPRKGTVYTVVGTQVKPGRVFLILAEYPNESFIHRAFRPLRPSRLDIFRRVNAPITEDQI